VARCAQRCLVELGVVFRCAVDLAVCRQTGGLAFTRQRTFLRERLIADALLNVVGFAGEDQERLVLRLPAKTSDGAVVAVTVESAAGAERSAVVSSVVEQRGFINVFHQSRAKCRSGDTENDIARGLRLGKTRLSKVAGARVRAACDGKQIFYSAIRIVGIRVAELVKEEGEAHFAHRPGGGDKRWNRVASAIGCRICHLRIRPGTGSTRSRLGMAQCAASGIEAGAKAGAGFDGAGNRINLLKCIQRVIEESQAAGGIVGGDRGKGTPGRSSSTNSWIGLAKGHSSKEQQTQGKGEDGKFRPRHCEFLQDFL